MDEIDRHLIKALNYEEAKQYLGGVIFVSVIMVIGFVGNLHVLLVYAFRMKPSNHRIFILVLGVVDLITCIVGMPFIIFHLRNPLTFTMASVCKVLIFTNYFTCTSSVFTLLVIAIDRYRKICVPFRRQITERMAKLSCILVFVISMFLSWPAPVLYGIATVQTSNPKINGSRCYTEDKENFVKYQAYFNAMLVLFVVVTLIVLLVLYTLTWRVITKHCDHKVHSNIERLATQSAQQHSTHSNKERPVTQSTQQHRAPSNTERARKSLTSYSVTTDISKISAGLDSTENDEHRIGSQKTSKGHTSKQNNSDRGRRTTLMFFMITLVFFLSYIPHFSLKIVAFLKKDFVAELSFTEKVLYNTFVWCCFINNMANCFIYGLFDMRFRSEASKMYSKIFFRA